MVLWGVFRESAINTPFIQPLRNAFSYHHESFAVTCWLCTTAQDHPFAELATAFAQQPMDVQLARARWYGVRYIIVISPISKARLFAAEGQHLVRALGAFGELSVFEINGSETHTITSLAHPPRFCGCTAATIISSAAKLRLAETL
jgi:hypothetical protein